MRLDLLRGAVVSAVLFAATPAWAGKTCVIDFQQAVTQTQEGTAAQKKIDTMYSARKGELERMQAELEKAIADYQSRAMILSPEARQTEEQKLALQQQNFERTYGTYQQEMQQTYMGLLGDLDAKMRTVSEAVGREQTCAIILDKQAVIFMSSEVADVTTTLVNKYNSMHPATP